jgi:hypothetical protein
MMIFSETFTCHICGTSFVVTPKTVGGRLDRSPVLCPGCTMPLKTVSPRQRAIGTARDLLLALLGSPDARRLYGDPITYLESNCLREEDVQHYVALAASMDLQAWGEVVTKLGRSRGRTTRSDQEILKALPELERLSSTGELRIKLAAVRDAVITRLRAEREQYLQEYAKRRR